MDDSTHFTARNREIGDRGERHLFIATGRQFSVVCRRSNDIVIAHMALNDAVPHTANLRVPVKFQRPALQRLCRAVTDAESALASAALLVGK